MCVSMLDFFWKDKKFPHLTTFNSVGWLVDLYQAKARLNTVSVSLPYWYACAYARMCLCSGGKEVHWKINPIFFLFVFI